MVNKTLDYAQAGMRALQSGDSETAIAHFINVVKLGVADSSIYLALAYAYQLSGNDDKSMTAVDQLLIIDPSNIRGLILKADLLLKKKSEQEALSYYRAVIKIAEGSPNTIFDLANELAHARERYQYLSQKFEKFVVDRVGGDSVINQLEAARFKHSVELLFGKKQLYYQSPRLYYFPGLPQIYFYDKKNFSWVEKLESATTRIRAELEVLLKENQAFQPYVKAEANRVILNPSSMLNNPDWSAFYLWKDGKEIKENTLRFPETIKALSEVPFCQILNRAPSVLFSLLKPGAKIPPHTGVLNTRLICHLPIIVPVNCGIRVGSEVHEWKEGKVCIFDDTMEHEAWNLSNQVRVILIFEIWRPELTRAERELVGQLMQSINEYQDNSMLATSVWDV